jgi:hypothetical protein
VSSCDWNPCQMIHCPTRRCKCEGFHTVHPKRQGCKLRLAACQCQLSTGRGSPAPVRSTTDSPPQQKTWQKFCRPSSDSYPRQFMPFPLSHTRMPLTQPPQHASLVSPAAMYYIHTSPMNRGLAGPPLSLTSLVRMHAPAEVVHSALQHLRKLQAYPM